MPEDKIQLESELTNINSKKEMLELEWIKLDDERKRLVEQLKIVLEKEKQAEEAEVKLELEEAGKGETKEKQDIEKKRWVIQDARRDAEKEKWPLQEKLWQIENLTKDHTTEYQKLLTEEEGKKKELEKITVYPQSSGISEVLTRHG